MNATTKYARFGLALTLCAVAVSTACGSEESSSVDDNASTLVLLGSGDDRLPNNTASEVVSFADHVVVAEVTSEEALPVPQEDIDRGEGLIMRSVTFRVAETIWSAPEAPPQPDSFDWTSLGWSFKKSVDNRTLAGYENSPRFNVGHTYIVALDWAQQDCADTGEWAGLGGSFNMPYEQDIIGVGEFEGRIIDQADLAEEAPSRGVRAAVWGKDMPALVGALRGAEIDEELQSQLGAADRDC